MWFEVATKAASPWQLWWEALAAIGTIGAVFVALCTTSKESRSRERESRARSGSNVQIQHQLYDDHEVIVWHIENNSTATISGFRHSERIEDIYGPIVDVDRYDSNHLAPGGIRDIHLSFHGIPSEMYLTFMDGNGVLWRATHDHEGMEVGEFYTLERVTPEDETLRTRLGRLLRAARAALNNWFTWKNIKSLRGILTGVSIAAFVFFSGFLTGNGI